MAFPMPMGQAAGPLDGPPPSPTPMSPPPDGGPFSMRGLAPQVVPTNQMPPEVLTGITSAAQTINQLLDSFAQATPDKAAMLAMMKDMLQQYLAELMAAGGGAISPTNAGQAPAMGGMDRGIAGPGSI